MLHPTFRRCIFWAHLATGVVVGLIIFILAVTGMLMSFETQIVSKAERSMVREKAPVQAALTPEELVEKFQGSGVEGRPTGLSLSSNAEDPAAFVIGRGNQQQFHPSTGESMGKGAEGTRKFFQTVLSIHRWLTLPTQAPEGQARAQGAGAASPGQPAAGAARPTTWKDIGGNINAAGALVFFFLLISGLFLWIPKKLAWRAFKPVLFVQPKLKGRARDWNWHNIAGFWASPFILVITVTGIIMFYPWANKLLFNAFGEQPPVRTAGGPGGAGGPPRSEGGGEGGAGREGGERRRGENRVAAAEGEAPRAEGAQVEEGRPRREGGEHRHRPEGTELAVGDGARVEGAGGGEDRPRRREGEERPRGEAGSAGAEGGGMRRGREGGGAASATGPIVAKGLNEAAEAAKKFMPEWKTLALELPSSDRQAFVATISDAGRGRPDRRVKLTLDRADLSITKQETFADLTTGTKMRQFVRWGHTGELGGWLGQLIAALTCALTIVLVWTGFALAWRRLMSKIKNKKKPAKSV